MKTKFIHFPDSPEVKGRARDNALTWLDRYCKLDDQFDTIEYVIDPVEGYLRYPWKYGEVRFYHSQGSQLAYRMEFLHEDDGRVVVLDVTKDRYFQKLWDEIYGAGVVENVRKVVFKN